MNPNPMRFNKSRRLLVLEPAVGPAASAVEVDDLRRLAEHFAGGSDPLGMSAWTRPFCTARAVTPK